MNPNIFRSKRFWTYALGGIAAAGLLYLIFAPDRLPVETARVLRGPFQEILTEDGVTRVREKFTLLAPVSGVLNRLTVHPGDRIRRGQRVAVIQWDQIRPVRAPTGGSVLRVHREDAGPIEMGAPLLEIGDPTSLEIVVDLLTADAVRVRPGTRVRIGRWGGEQTLEGTVRRIEPSAFTKISALGVEEQRVNALVDITSPPGQWEHLGDNFRVECTLVLSSHDDIMQLPSGAVFRAGDDWVVFRVDEGGIARETRVSVAGRNPTTVSLAPREKNQTSAAGTPRQLQEGDSVIVYPGSEIADGMPVREL
ncbi:MAG: HlyD family efflux transporter periplasmic adaptor subunit [bacterium]|nr:HlyD family efflux transporter periplasmic adaptor subunit [bacterium]